MASYRGWVVAPVKDGREGWVAISSVKKVYARDPDLKTEKDISVHLQDISGTELWVGMELEFNVTDDPDRENAYRVLHGFETSESKIAHFANGGVELSVEGLGASRILAQPSVFVSWCLSPEVVAKIREARLRGAKMPRLLLIDRVVNDPHSERRYLANLDDSVRMLTVAFGKSGTHRIVAVITEKDSLLARQNGYYRTDVLDEDETGLVIDSYATAFVDVKIPEGLFAGKPRDWAWVNRWYSEPPFDECAFRRRQMFAYGLQWELMGIGYFLWGVAAFIGWLCSATIAVVLLVVGVRPYTGSLKRPWDNDPRDTWRLAKGGSVFWPLVEGQRVPFAILLHPAFWVALWLFAKWMWPENDFVRRNVHDIGWETYAILAAGSAFLVFVLGQLTESLRAVSRQFEAAQAADEPARVKAAQEAFAKREAIQAEARRKLIEAEVADLICEATGPREPGVEHLRLSFRTIPFFVQELKRKVCRPFAS